MNEIIISIGTNLGNKKENLNLAINYILENKKIKLIKKSAIYETEPVEMNTKNYFLNIIIIIESKLNPIFLLKFLQQIENKMGRLTNSQNFLSEKVYLDRVIDIDIIDYSRKILDIKNLLTLPHKKMHERKFVLAPLAEIFPGWIHPILKKSAKQLFEDLHDNYKCEKIIY